MLDALIVDFMFMLSDLVSGKALPVLVAISILPLDQHLLGAMVVFGVVCGTWFTMMYGWSLRGKPLWLFFNAFLSVSFLFRMVKHLAGVEAASLSVIPAYFVILHTAPDKTSSLLLMLFLSGILFWICIGYERPILALETSDTYYRTHFHQRLLLGDSSLGVMTSKSEKLESTGKALGYAAVIFVLSFYATVQFTCTKKNIHLIWRLEHSVLVGVMSSVVRIFVFVTASYFQNNVMHMILEDNPGALGIPPICVWLYAVVLLYTCAWNCSMITMHESTHNPMYQKVLWTGMLVALGFAFQWSDPWVVFWFTLVITGLSVISQFVIEFASPNKKVKI